MTIRAVLWDMDGTLVDSEPAALEALSEAIRDAGIPPPDDLGHSVMGSSADAIYRWLVDDFGLKVPPVRWEEMKLERYVAKMGMVRPIDGALETWTALAAVGIPQAIVSNSDRLIVNANVAVAGLARPGLCTVSRNDVRDGKPAPEGYLRAAWLLGIPPEECLVLEDSAPGYLAGVAAGMTTLLVPHAGTLRDSKRLADFDDLKRFLPDVCDINGVSVRGAGVISTPPAV